LQLTAQKVSAVAEILALLEELRSTEVCAELHLDCSQVELGPESLGQVLSALRSLQGSGSRATLHHCALAEGALEPARNWASLVGTGRS